VVSRHSTRAEFDAAREDLRPDAVLAAPDTAARWGLDEDPGADPVEVLDGWLTRPVPDSGWAPGRWGDGAAIGLTSGSTGRAKGVVQSEHALRYAGRCTVDAVGLQPGDRLAGMVPLSSMAALCFGLYLPLMLGGTAVLRDRWDPAGAVSWLAEHRARWTMCVPTMALQLAGAVDGEDPRPLRHMRAMTVGGGPMDVGALERAERRLGTPILRVFGMSECLGHTTPHLDDPADLRLGADGLPFPGTDVRVRDDAGEDVPDGQQGRVVVRGPSLFLGYARAGAVVAPELTPDGFLVTGDLGELRPDGSVLIRGRSKDVIIRGGRNIDVNEVESALASHPLVDQVCVVAVLDELLGERIAALVVGSDPVPDLAALGEHLAQGGLSKTKWPEFVFPVAGLPQNRVGKLDRAGARRLAEQRRRAAVDS
jgi:acyl-CoA synthetase (AMP-forming)/AMP-acid ligase II